MNRYRCAFVGDILAIAFALLGFFICAALVCMGVYKSAHAETIPRAALDHRTTLTREARMVGGLNAPIALFAAQIHQESGWREQAASAVGAVGLAQFMPATATWWCALTKTAASACQPTNPTWAIRALVGYDYWLLARVHGVSEFDRWWAALRSYNGGLGHWLDEAKIAKAEGHTAIDAACGRAKRKPSFCPENLGYPRRIMLALQPLYLSWGRGVLS